MIANKRFAGVLALTAAIAFGGPFAAMSDAMAQNRTGPSGPSGPTGPGSQTTNLPQFNAVVAPTNPDCPTGQRCKPVKVKKNKKSSPDCRTVVIQMTDGTVQKVCKNQNDD